MKRNILVILTLIFVLLLSACGGQEAVSEEAVEVEEQEEAEPVEALVEEVEEEVEEVLEEEEPEEIQELALMVEKEQEIFLDAFMEINHIDENLSYVEIPIFTGPENLVGLWNQEVGLGFYDEYLGYWEEVKRAQEDLDAENDFSDFTVFRLTSSVFEGPGQLVLLSRYLSVFGYNWLDRDSAVFYIDKETGDALEAQDQLAAFGRTMEEALGTLQLFQEENSQVSFSQLSVSERTDLYNEDEGVQAALRSLYGTDRPVILNDFTSAEAYLNTDVFLAEIEGEDYYVFKLLLVSLEENMLDGSYREDLWVGLPADYEGGTLEKDEDPSGLLDALYQ